MNRGLAGEVVRMALDTLRSNKLRSALTILGVVIGITAIVGMTSLIRGFDQSLRDSVKALGPSTIILTKLSIVSISSGAEFSDLLRRPNLTVDDAKAIEKLAPTIEIVDILLGTGLSQTNERMYYRGERTKQLTIVGATEQFAEARFAKVTLGRFFTEPEVLHRRRVVVLGETAYQGLFAKSGLDPINKKVRIGAVEYTVVGVLEKAPSVGGFGNDQDDMVVIPQTTHQVLFSTNATRRQLQGQNSATIMIVPYAWATREEALADVEEIMRIRHGLRLDEPNDFDLATQDAILRVWDQISRATFLALIVISSIALMVGRHRRDGDHDDFGDGADAGDRRAQGAGRPPAGDPVSVSLRGRGADLDRRDPRHPVRQRHRPVGDAGHRLPDLAALVVVRDWARLLRRRRHLLRDGAGGARVAPRSDRGAAARVGRQLAPPCTSRSDCGPASAGLGSDVGAGQPALGR